MRYSALLTTTSKKNNQTQLLIVNAFLKLDAINNQDCSNGDDCGRQVSQRMLQQC